MEEDFYSAVEEAKSLEKSAQPYTGFKGKVEFEKVLDLEPKEFADYTYTDLVNLYERADKIIKTSAGIGLYGAPGTAGAAAKAGAAPAVKKEMKARSEEVESKVKALTTEALSGAEKIGKEPVALPQAPKPEAKPSEEIELERLVAPPIELERELMPERPRPEPESGKEEKPEFDFELPEARKEEEIQREERERAERDSARRAEEEGKEEEEKGKGGIEIEGEEKEIPRPAPREAPPAREARPRPQVSAPIEREMPAPAPQPKPAAARPPMERPAAAPVPPVLRERAEEAASRKYSDIEQQIISSLGQEVDEASLKKRMLSLTKELFKEKSLNRREQIKLEITVLKDMLARKATKKPAGRGAAAEAEVRGRLLETLVSTQKTELADAKDRILSNYKAQLDTYRQKFQDSVGSLPEEDTAGRKAAFDKLTFQLTSLMEQLPSAVSKYQDYTTQKHESEIRKLKSSLGPGDEKLASDSDARLKAIDDEYAREFSSVRAIMKKQVDAAIEIAGRAAFGKEAVSPKEAKVQELVAEVNEMDEGTLLYMLHTKDPEYYKKYERKHVSRQEAIFRAKEIAAREKGLSDDMVRRYFSETEG